MDAMVRPSALTGGAVNGRLRNLPRDSFSNVSVYLGGMTRTAIVVPGHGTYEPAGYRISSRCRRLVARPRASRCGSSRPWWCSPGGRHSVGPRKAEQMRDAWRGPDRRARRRADGDRDRRERRTHAAAPARPRHRARDRASARRSTLRATRYFFQRLYAARGIEARVPYRAGRADRRGHSSGSSPRCRLRARSCARRSPSSSGRDERHARLHPGLERGAEPPGRPRRPARASFRTPTCSSSTTARPTRPPRSRAQHGAEVLSLGANRGLRVGIAAGYRYALEHDYAFCGRVDADGQHPGARARPPARARPRGRLRRRRRLALRLGRRLRAVPLPAEPGAPLRHGRAAPRDGARARRAVRRRHERPLRRQREGAAAARARRSRPARPRSRR